jgi:hypothetical protein
MLRRHIHRYIQEGSRTAISPQRDRKFFFSLSNKQLVEISMSCPGIKFSWTMCYSDTCEIHRGDKEGSGWFPRKGSKSRRRRKRNSQSTLPIGYNCGSVECAACTMDLPKATNGFYYRLKYIREWNGEVWKVERRKHQRNGRTYDTEKRVLISSCEGEDQIRSETETDDEGSDYLVSGDEDEDIGACSARLVLAMTKEDVQSLLEMRRVNAENEKGTYYFVSLIRFA